MPKPRESLKEKLEKHMGHLGSLAGVQAIEYQDGYAKGLRAYLVHCGPLEFTALIDKALDIATLRFKGKPYHYTAPAGLMHPRFWTDGQNSHRSIDGGMLFTCGLAHVGPAERGPEDFQPQHGMLRSLPAVEHSASFAWNEAADDYVLSMQGRMVEAQLFGRHLILDRRISCSLKNPMIQIEDRITNASYSQTQAIMLMYHINAGYPLLSQDTRLEIDAHTTRPRDAIAEAGLADKAYLAMGPPLPGFKEEVFYHQLPARSGLQEARIVNAQEGMALRIAYDARELPHLIQWKSLDTQNYVLGVEPANCFPEGYARQKERGQLRRLAPQEDMTCLVQLIPEAF